MADKVYKINFEMSDGTTESVFFTAPQGEKGEDGIGTSGIPDYWQTALDDGVKAINAALCTAGSNKSAFLFYSDAHWNYGSQMSPTLLKYLYQHTGMTKTFFGGDIVNDEASDYDAMEYLWDWRNRLKDLPNHHSVVGNHDDGNATNNLFSAQYVYGYLLAPEETPDMVRGDDGFYYYIDSPAEKTRYLCLDTGYEGLSSLSAAQTSFITEALKSTLSGWHIVVIAHIWYIPDYDQYNVRPIPLTGLSSSAAALATILDDYNARNGDFESCGAKVEFCIGGHVHRDYIGSTTGGVPIILCETDSYHIRGEFVHAAGTDTEAAVSGIVADYDSKKVSVVRVGRGNSFTVDLSSENIQYYTVTQTLTNVSSSNNAISVVEGEAFETTLTATSGSLASVVVTMGGVDITADVYADGVVSIPSVSGIVVITATAESSGTDEPDTPTYTNVLDTVGYQTGHRINSAGNVVERADRCVTGLIAATTNDTIYFKNITMQADDYGANIAHYDSTQTPLSGKSYVMSALGDYAVYDTDGVTIKSIRPGEHEGVAYVRFCFVNIDENSIITINEPIE